MCDLVFSIQEFLKIVPGLILFPFSLYFVWKKLNYKVTASITFHHQRTVAPRIGEVVLSNLKDAPLTIFAIYAVLGKDVSIQVEKFDPPIILKPLETAKIETRPYSRLVLDGQKYDPDFLSPTKIDIYLVLSNKIIKCIRANHPDLEALPVFLRYRHAIKETRTFNKIVYNEYARYAITYRIKSNIITAIVDTGGFIGDNWDFPFNVIPPQAMATKDDIKQFLEQSIFSKLTDGFSVDELK